MLVVVASVYLLGGYKSAPTTIGDIHGYYDEGSAMCDWVAYDDANGLRE